ncbi:cobalmin ABC transporter substrate-binding protein [Advenella kashmirensis W13003]|uniref:Cobalmin ABC transporter substrate-binding protein n=1 Tax=Advenella kashmirensis W13003 TaxID=1424334 RepID=V8QY04_9BURK|nr:helical backbone metal receptor [Advenella kashmirensis]ETF04248.1 cobalmin ABC transporter substrate-binding protein [Advenella kashmirensis W13003]
MVSRKRTRFLHNTNAMKIWLLAALLCIVATTGPARADIGKTAVSLAPHLTELMFAAGAGNHLLGVSEASNYPTSVASLPRVGSGVAPNAERIALLRPDVILAWGYTNRKDLYPALRKLKLPVHYQAPVTLDDIVRDIDELGELFGTQAAARTTTQALQDILNETRLRYRDAVKVKVFALVGLDPLYTLDNRSFVIDALRACGAQSAFPSLSTPASIISREQLLLAHPQAVLFGSKQIDAESRMIANYFADLGTALQPDQLIGQDPDILFRPTDRLIRSLPQLCSRIDQIRRRLSPVPSESPLPPPRHQP